MVDKLDIISNQLRVEAAGVKRELLAYLSNLQREIDNTVADVENDRRTGCVTQHFSTLAELTGKWNTICQLGWIMNDTKSS